MTVTTVRSQAPALPEPPWSERRRRHWLRLVIPFVVVLLGWILTAVAHAYQEPDLGDAGTLAPSGTGRHGSSQLAEKLRAAGVGIERVTSSAAAVTAANQGDATVFVPAPDYLTPTFVAELTLSPRTHRIVLVRPGTLARRTATVPAGLRSSRFATATVDPDCDTDYARQAGPAALRRDVYDGASPTTRCYGGSVIGFKSAGHEILFVGATDPFRNDRIAEAGNAALATGLLSEFGRVIWVDVHSLEAVPRSTATDANPGLPKPPPYERGDRDRTNTGIILFDAFPVQLWAVMVVLLIGAALLALVRARRLGPPVAEPLPVLVPAAETVTGRGRLYERINAREASLSALRASAIARMARVLDPLASAAPERELTTAGPAAERFVSRIAARSGVPAEVVETVLYGPIPDDDASMLAAVAELDQLVSAVVRDRPDPATPRPSGGTP
jgi:Domain of unknown function (DUF4350)